MNRGLSLWTRMGTISIVTYHSIILESTSVFDTLPIPQYMRTVLWSTVPIALFVFSSYAVKKKWF